MPPKNKIKYIPAAVDDMDEIFSYIAKDNITTKGEFEARAAMLVGREKKEQTNDSIEYVFRNG